jgi:hypothetical protein
VRGSARRSYYRPGGARPCPSEQGGDQRQDFPPHRPVPSPSRSPAHPGSSRASPTRRPQVPRQKPVPRISSTHLTQCPLGHCGTETYSQPEVSQSTAGRLSTPAPMCQNRARRRGGAGEAPTTGPRVNRWIDGLLSAMVVSCGRRAHDSKSTGGNPVRVRLSPRAL